MTFARTISTLSVFAVACLYARFGICADNSTPLLDIGVMPMWSYQHLYSGPCDECLQSRNSGLTYNYLLAPGFRASVGYRNAHNVLVAGYVDYNWGVRHDDSSSDSMSCTSIGALVQVSVFKCFLLEPRVFGTVA